MFPSSMYKLSIDIFIFFHENICGIHRNAFIIYLLLS